MKCKIERNKSSIEKGINLQSVFCARWDYLICEANHDFFFLNEKY